MRAATVQVSLRIRAVSPEPPVLAHTSSESRGTFRQKARSLASLNGWACTVTVCHDGMLEDTNSLDAGHFASIKLHFGQVLLLGFSHLIILTHNGGYNQYKCHSLLLPDRQIWSQNISTITLFIRECKPSRQVRC